MHNTKLSLTGQRAPVANLISSRGSGFLKPILLLLLLFCPNKELPNKPPVGLLPNKVLVGLLPYPVIMG